MGVGVTSGVEVGVGVTVTVGTGVASGKSWVCIAEAFTRPKPNSLFLPGVPRWSAEENRESLTSSLLFERFALQMRAAIPAACGADALVP